MELRTRYVIKGIGKQQTINSIVNIATTPDGKISKVEDKWNGNLPESAFVNVSVEKILTFHWWTHYVEGWAWWTWSFWWYTWPWLVRYLVGFGDFWRIQPLTWSDSLLDSD